MTKITILGTSSMVPTKKRNASATFLEYKTDGILFDCGEGTQRQMNITGIKRTKVTKILISHWHGDHIAGLIGLLQTLSTEELDTKLEIYGPIETKKRMKHILEASYFYNNLKLKIVELKPGKKPETFFENDDYKLECVKLEHSTPVVGYAFIEKERLRIKKPFLKKNNIGPGPHMKKLQKGQDIVYKGKKYLAKDATYKVSHKKFAYVLDTQLCDGAINIAKDSDILLIETTYKDDLQQNAKKTKHLTTKDAGYIANSANVKKMIITHFSPRYKNEADVEENARKYFDNSEAARDFMKITL